MFSLTPTEEASLAKPCSVPYWDLLQAGEQGKVEFPLPLRHMLFSLFPKPDGTAAAWSLPAPVRPDLPRQSLSVPVEPESGGGLSSRWVKQSTFDLLAVILYLEQGTEPPVEQDLKRRYTVADRSLLNVADEQK